MFFILLLISFSAMAEEFYTLEEILIRENQIDSNEKSTNDIDEEALEVLAAGSLDDILRASSVATTTGGPRSSSEGIQIRGLNADKSFIYIDGVKQNFRMSHSTMILVDVDNLKTVKIHENAQNFSLHDSIGGGVEFISKDAQDYLAENPRFSSSVKTQYNSVNDEKLLNIVSLIDKKSLLSFGSRRANDTKLSDNTSLDRSAYEDIGLRYKNKFSHYRILFDFYRRQDNAPLNPTLNPPIDLDVTKDLHGKAVTNRQSLTVSHEKGRESSSFSMNQQDQEKERFSDKAIERRKNTSFALEHKRRLSFGTVGVHLEHESLKGEGDDERINSYPDARAIRVNAYVQNRRRQKQLEFDYGVKASSYSLSPDKSNIDKVSGSGLVGKLAVKHNLRNDFNYSLSYVQAFNPPRLNNVFPEGLHHRGDGFVFVDNYFIPNTKLSHETSDTFELKANFERRVFSDLDLFKLSYSRYWTKAKDYIYFEKVDRSVLDDEFGSTQFINIPDASLRGAHIALEYLYSSFSFKANYSRLRGVNKTRKLFLADLPADQILYDLSYNFGDDEWSVGYLGTKAFAQNRINPETTERTDATPGYFIHGAYIGKSFLNKRLKLNLRVDNIGNKEYRRHGSNINESAEDIKLMARYIIQK